MVLVFLVAQTLTSKHDHRSVHRLMAAEKHMHVFVLETPFFSHKESGSASLDAPLCTSMVVGPCVWLAYVSELLRPCLLSRESPCTRSLHPPAVAALWDTVRRTEPRLSHSCLALLHSSNNANYISNGNRWGLVRSSHSLERFTNIHQRGHWSVWASSFKGWTSQGAGGPIR